MNRWMKSLTVAVAAGMLLGGSAFAEPKDAILPLAPETSLQQPLASTQAQPASTAASIVAPREPNRRAVPVAAKGDAAFDRLGESQLRSRAMPPLHAQTQHGMAALGHSESRASELPDQGGSNAAHFGVDVSSLETGHRAMPPLHAQTQHGMAALGHSESRASELPDQGGSKAAHFGVDMSSLGSAHAMPPLHTQTQHGMLALGHAESRASELPDASGSHAAGRSSRSSTNAAAGISRVNDRADLSTGSRFDRIGPSSHDAMFERVSSGVERFSFRSFPERPRINASRMAGYGL